MVIIGGGQAASSAAAKLRELDAEVAITMVCAEPVLPYQRPPLSKKYLSGEMPLERLVLRPQSWFDEQNVSVLLGCKVNSIDSNIRRVELEDGTSLDYEKLLIATGSHARTLPAEVGGNLKNVHTLRSTSDADVLAPVLASKAPLVIVGGGYIGLEVAAVAAQAGVDVTLVEMADRILQRVASPQTSDFFRKLHVSHGVKILEGVGLSELVGTDGSVSSVVLDNGTTLDAGSVLCGIGVLPTDELGSSAGLDIKNGIEVDPKCRTSNEHIFAAGDCANFDFFGQRIRLESVPNAINQAENAAINMLGGEQDYVATPWFWSDQFDVKLQIAGLNIGYDHTIVRPGKREGAQSVWYYRGEKLLAVDAMNDAPAFMMARKIIESGKTIAPNLAADPQTNLKEFV